MNERLLELEALAQLTGEDASLSKTCRDKGWRNLGIFGGQMEENMTPKFAQSAVRSQAQKASRGLQIAPSACKFLLSRGFINLGSAPSKVYNRASLHAFA